MLALAATRQRSALDRTAWSGNRLLHRRMIAALAFLPLVLPSRGQAPPNPNVAAFVAWAKVHAAPIQTVEPGNNFDDLHEFRRIIGNAHIVELGEPTHGSHEPLALRNRLFQYAVENLGFTAIAVETGFPESRRIADYVAGGPGDLPQIVRESFTWGFGNFQENADLVEWMRHYNADPAHRRKIHFYGIDLSLGGPSGGTPTPRAVRAALAYLDRVDPASAKTQRAALAPYMDRLPADTVPFSADDHDHLTAAISDLVSLLERERLHDLAAGPTADYEWACRNAIVARQQDQGFRDAPADAPGRVIPPDAWRDMSDRNQAMAENVRWVAGQEGSAGRVLVFAHLMHVVNAPTAGGSWSDLHQEPNTMGQYLRSMFGGDLLIIGMSGGTTASGSSIDKSHDPGLDFLDDALAQIGRPQLVVDLRLAASAPDAAHWLAEPNAIHVNGGDTLKIVPGSTLDAVVYIDKLSPCHPLNPTAPHSPK